MIKPNPLSDVIAFLHRPGWPTPVFWALLIAGILIAIYAFAAIPGQRRFGAVGNRLFRTAIGAMWWQQTLRKLSPLCTDHPDAPFGQTGLAHSMTIMENRPRSRSRPISSTKSCCRAFIGLRRSFTRSRS